LVDAHRSAQGASKRFLRLRTTSTRSRVTRSSRISEYQASTVHREVAAAPSDHAGR
jgi:hypothetical protein